MSSAVHCLLQVKNLMQQLLEGVVCMQDVWLIHLKS